MADLPTGTVTFLFTDIEDSTRLWQEYPQAMQTVCVLGRPLNYNILLLYKP